MTAGGARDDTRRQLPGVDALLRMAGVEEWIDRWGRRPVKEALRRVLDQHRSAGRRARAPGTEELLREALADLEADAHTLRPVLNGTGVILHTNLGRAPLSAAASAAAARAAERYSSLEYDVATGGRGDRYAHCADLLCRLTGSEASLVVNNNAAAVSLVINELARGRDVVVSRGELVEIGGGFRLPEVIERSGAFLEAVGTTNKTRIDDYARALTPSTGLLLKVHPSNYRVEGFVEDTPLAELVALGRRRGVPVLHDQGSGLILPDGAAVGLDEPSPGAAASLGTDVVTWSGDKLLGGPQAGLIHGKAEILSRLRSNPLLRAFRVDKMTLAALEATLRAYLDPERARREVPALRMLSETEMAVEERCRRALDRLAGAVSPRVRVVRLASVVGGGSAPGVTIPSAGWALDGPADALDRAFRDLPTPLVGRVKDGRFTVDFRTILPGEEPQVARAVDAVLGGGRGLE